MSEEGNRKAEKKYEGSNSVLKKLKENDELKQIGNKCGNQLCQR